jgi:hypothetical protein
MPVTYREAARRASVRVARPGQMLAYGTVFWISRSGNTAKVRLVSGHIISVHPSQLELIE